MFILPEIPLSPKRYFEDFVPQIMFDDMIHSSSIVLPGQILTPGFIVDLGSMIVSSPIIAFSKIETLSFMVVFPHIILPRISEPFPI